MPWDIATCDFLIGQRKWETELLDIRFTEIWRHWDPRWHASFALLRPSRILHWKLSRSIHTRDQFKPLPQCVTQGQRQRVDVPEDDVKWERELLHVRFDFWQLSRAKYRHSDVKYGVFVGRVVKNHENHKYAGFSPSSNGFLHSLQGETQWRVNYSDFEFPIFHVTHYIAQKISNQHKFNERLNRPGSRYWTIL